MFFVISRIEQASHWGDGLQNPKNQGNPMALGIYRILTRTAICNIYSKKCVAEFWDDTEKKKIPKRLWTPEMKAFAAAKIAEAPKAPYIFKFTIVGWLFVLTVIGLFGFLVYDSLKPPLPQSAEYVAMEKSPMAGDIYFGRYEAFKQPGDRIASEIGFGWFKILKAEGNVYYISKSREMSRTSLPKEQLNSSDFEVEGTPTMITEQTGYSISMKAADGKMEIYISDKK